MMWFPYHVRLGDGSWIQARTNRLLPTTAATEEPKTALTEAEDTVGRFLEASSELAELVMWRMLRLKHPHWSSQPVEIDREIRKVSKTCPG